ncbi:uncharacterized protein LOC143375021 isoform X2 [Andrena cerasifolii]|uniref:uncharacterized protein LOC143375021 isoform X2 n=1 Tax=Andrena cerasifolii TaxID=2819439 RepID=UPI004038096D
MRTVAVWTAFVLAYSSSPLVVAGIRYIGDPISAQSGNTGGGGGDISEKRPPDQNEPTCKELKAVWRYTKRQSRATKAAAVATTGYYSLYPDPFTFNLWKSYFERPKQQLNRQGSYPPVKARNRAGGPPIYGKMVHKAPAGSRFRNGMRHSPRSFDKIPPYYGTINAYPPSQRRRPSSYRTMGGGSPPLLSQVPQAGRFQDLRNLMRAERLRELQELHKADEIAEKAAFGDTTDDDDDDDFQSNMQSRKQFSKPTKMKYEFNQERYSPNMPNIGQAWSRSGPQPREYTLR